MDWINRLNSSIEYIEEHLTESIEYEKVAQVALCSSYHFQRMFSYMAEMTISEYIRKRRMSRAAIDLINGEKVIDVAVKYCYDSPTSFNRAFRNMHNCSPSALKNNPGLIKTFTPIRFSISIKGAEEMEFKIVNKESIRVVGITQKITDDMEKNMEQIPRMWQKAHSEGTIEKLCLMMNGEPQGILGLSIGSDVGNWIYAIGVASESKIDSTLEELIIPEATWAVFHGRGSNLSIQELIKRIHSEWFPTSGYDYGFETEIEVYCDPVSDNMNYEVWLPVVPKLEN